MVKIEFRKKSKKELWAEFWKKMDEAKKIMEMINEETMKEAYILNK